ncbi:MAG: PD-(D/E)XK nuclease family protein, partial [Sphingobacteriales bacterium]
MPIVRVYNQLAVQDGDAPIEPAKFYPIARVILSDFAQIDNDMVDADRLFSELEDIAVINHQFDFLTDEQREFLAQFWSSYSEGKYKKQQELFIRMWRRMPALYQAFHRKLREQGLTTVGALYRAVANGEFEEKISAYASESLVFVGFNALSRAEATSFKRWQEEGKAIFYFDADTYYLEDRVQEAGLFLRRNIENIGLVNQIPATSNFSTQVARKMNVLKVQGQTAQGKIVHELLKAQEGKNTSTAIVLADEQLLIPVLQTIPDQETDPETGRQIPLPVNITMGFGLTNSAVFGLADTWLNAQAELAAGRTKTGKQTVKYTTAQAFLSHPLTGMSANIK